MTRYKGGFFQEKNCGKFDVHVATCSFHADGYMALF